MVSIKDVPKPLINAILAAEDERFYQHSGVDYVGVARAAHVQFRLRRRAPGRQHHHHAGRA